MVYYLQQHSTILSQISQQIASIAPQVSIPSIPPPPFPPFNPSASDIRINAFWFMALAFSLSAALLAILVQQWVRDYMHVFQRYSDLQKSARIRQYLYEGSEGWYMPVAAEAVPGLLHVALFLFFAGLADSTLNINTTIGVATTVPIGICGLLYLFTTFAPVIYPQSPYQTSFSGLIWYTIQKLHGRIFKDWDGESKSVSTNMAQGQMQLSMEETKERKGRDRRAIRWLLDNLTEEAEMESFVMAIPGSLKGLEVWAEWSKEDDMTLVAQRLRETRNVDGLIPLTGTDTSHHAAVHRPELHLPNIHRSIVTTSTYERNTIRELCRRIGHLSDTCKNRAVFPSDELWRRRSRACAEAMASLIFYANAEIGWFGHTLQALGDIDSFEGVRNLSLAGRDQKFIVRWTCLSIRAIRPTLTGRKHSISYADYMAQDRKAREADETLELRRETEHESDLSSKISFAATIIQEVEDGIRDIIQPPVDLSKAIYEVIQRITHQLPGVDFDPPNSDPFLRQTLEVFFDPAKLGFISSRQSPKKFLDYLRRIDAYQNNSPDLEHDPKRVVGELIWPKKLLQRRLWSLDDLLEGGPGFTVEVFLLSFKQLLSTYPSHESYSALYIRTFRAITSDRRKYGAENFVGTQNILLDVVASDQGFLRTFKYPDYITDEVWALLGDMFEGQTGRHVDIAVQKLTDLQCEVSGRYEAKVSALVTRLRATRSRASTSSDSDSDSDLDSDSDSDSNLNLDADLDSDSSE